MPVPTYTVACLQNRLIATDVYEIKFQKPDGFTFLPGQFVIFDVPLVENPSDLQPRAYSISSVPEENDLLLVVKLKPGGRASRWIAEKLKEGDTVIMKGPFGKFVLPQTHEKDYFFICTGAGIAPFRSQIIAALKAGIDRRIDLLFGVRAETDLFWVDEFQNLAKTYPNFFLHLALSNPSPAWTGHRGRVQTLVPQIIREAALQKVYICGNPDMTKEVKELCLSLGIEKTELHVEGYI